MSQLVRYRLETTPNGTISTAPARPEDALEEAIKQNYFGGSLYGPSGSNYCDESPEIRQRYRQMFRDATVKAAVLSKVWDVAALTLQVLPDDPENDRDRLIADFNRDNILNAKGGVRALVESILFGALMDGYSVCHKRVKRAERGRWAGKLVLDALRPKDSLYYDLKFDDFRNVVGVIDKYADREQDRILPVSDFVIVRHLQIFDSPFGMSDFRAADRAFCYLAVVMQLRIVYLEKWKGPFLHGKYSNDEIKKVFGEKLAQARANGWIVTDKDSDVAIVNLATGSEESFQAACNDYREEIATAITGAFLQMMAGQVPGGRGDTTEHTSQAKLFRWYLARLVCDAANDQIVPQFTDANFSGSPAYPKASLEGTNPAEVTADLENAALKLDMGGRISRKELDERSGWGSPDLNDPEDVIEKAAPIPIPTNVTGAAAAVAGNGAPNGKPAKPVASAAPALPPKAAAQ